jgi:hypothetical protein
MRHLVLLALFVTSLVMAGCSDKPQTTRPTGMGAPQTTHPTSPK